MILIASYPERLALSILHVCGDDPQVQLYYEDELVYSPRMWRWSHKFMDKFTMILVFSTYVEMILKKKPDDEKQFGILHVCGDDP